MVPSYFSQWRFLTGKIGKLRKLAWEYKRLSAGLQFLKTHFSLASSPENKVCVLQTFLHVTGQWLYVFYIVSFNSVSQSGPTLCDPMDHSTPGFPVHHQLPDLAQTHVHQVGDAVQPSQPPLSPSPPALNLSQHQGLESQFFASVGQSIGALVPPMNIQDWFLLGLTSLISLQSKGLSRVFSSTTVEKHQFSSTL